MQFTSTSSEELSTGTKSTNYTARKVPRCRSRRIPLQGLKPRICQHNNQHRMLQIIPRRICHAERQLVLQHQRTAVSIPCKVLNTEFRVHCVHTSTATGTPQVKPVNGHT